MAYLGERQAASLEQDANDFLSLHVNSESIRKEGARKRKREKKRKEKEVPTDETSP